MSFIIGLVVLGIVLKVRELVDKAKAAVWDGAVFPVVMRWRRFVDKNKYARSFFRFFHVVYTRVCPRGYMYGSCDGEGLALVRRLPPVAKGTVRLAVISDTHGEHDMLRVPPCDILVHCGDALNGGGNAKTATAFIAWIRAQVGDAGPAKSAVVIGGNHDAVLQRWGAKKCKGLFHPVHWLEDSEVVLEGLTLYGAPHTVPSDSNNNAWQYVPVDLSKKKAKKSNPDNRRSVEVLREKWAAIPDSADVLVSHCPPLSDDLGVSEGCPFLHEATRDNKSLLLHVFGHDHKGYGATRHGGRGPLYANASSMQIPFGTLLPLPPRPIMVVDVAKGA